jgi:hypothetical protein
MSDIGDFAHELERELHRLLDPIAVQPIPPRTAARSGHRMQRLLGGAGAAVAVKLSTGFAIAALAATAAGAATEIAITGSVNPNDWGQQVKATVAACKDSLRASGTRGIGQCVSAFAKQHGRADGSTNQGHGNGNGNGNGKDKNKDKDKNPGPTGPKAIPTPGGIMHPGPPPNQ